jgi:hypothetical protein
MPWGVLCWTNQASMQRGEKSCLHPVQHPDSVPDTQLLTKTAFSRILH